MESIKVREPIEPTWYSVQKSNNGNPYIQLPQRHADETVFLTAIQPTDNAAMAAILDNPQINDRLVSAPKPYTLENADFWITLQLSGKSALYLQTIRSGDPETGAFIGAVSLIPADLAPSQEYIPNDNLPGDYELGYYLNPDYHRKGIMRNAVLAALIWGIKEAGVKSVAVSAEEDNTGSVKIIESFHMFSREGAATEVTWPEGKGGGVRKLLKWRWDYNG